MRGTTNYEYHRKRAARELAWAAHCVDPAIARLHRELAELHRNRAAESGSPVEARRLGPVVVQIATAAK